MPPHLTHTQVDVLQAVRHNWEIIVFSDTGGLAKTIHQAWREQRNRNRNNAANSVGLSRPIMTAPGSSQTLTTGIDRQSKTKFDASIDEIVNFGHLNFLRVGPHGDSVDDVKQLVTQRLVGAGSSALSVSPCLLAAWKTYGELSEAAEKEETAHFRSLMTLLLVGFITTFLVVLRAQLDTASKFMNRDLTLVSCASGSEQQRCEGPLIMSEDILLKLVTMFPILQSVLLVIR
jgi:hypothetical protein